MAKAARDRKRKRAENQTVQNFWSDEARAAAALARAASAKLGGKAGGLGSQAWTAKEHLEAADAHRAARRESLPGGKVAQAHLEAVVAHKRAAEMKTPIKTNSARSVWNRLYDFLTGTRPLENAAPRHQETGQFLPPGAGNGRGPVHGAAVDAASRRNDHAPEEDDEESEDEDGDQPTGNARTNQARDATAPARGQGRAGDKNYTGTDVDEVTRTSPDDMVEADEPDDHLEDDAPGRTGAARTSAAMRSVKNRRTTVSKPVTRNDNGDDDDDECPECGGEMVDGKCEDCGYTENARVDNAFPPGPQHQASREAAGASVMTEHSEARDRGLQAMDASGGGDSPEAANHHLATARMHDKAATSAREDGDHSAAQDHDNAAMLHRKAASIHRASPIEPDATQNRSSAARSAAGTTNRGGTNMDRKNVIRYITGNSKDWTGQEKLLQALPDPQLASLARGVRDSIVANSAMAGFRLPEGAEAGNYVYNDAGKLIHNNGGSASADAPGARGSVQAGGEEDEEETTDTTFPSRKGKGLEGGGVTKSSATANANWRQTLPPDVLEVVDNALRVNKTVRTRLLERLTANARDGDHRKRLVSNYSKFSTEALQDAVAAMPEAQVNNAFVEPPIDGAEDLNFLGGAGGPLVNAATGDEVEVEAPATLNYNEIASERLVAKLKTG
jgi:hypothetical protein